MDIKTLMHAILTIIISVAYYERAINASEWAKSTQYSSTFDL